MVDIVGEIMYVSIDQWKLTNFASAWALHINIILQSMYQHECLFYFNNTILEASQGKRIEIGAMLCLPNLLQKLCSRRHVAKE